MMVIAAAIVAATAAAIVAAIVAMTGTRAIERHLTAVEIMVTVGHTTRDIVAAMVMDTAARRRITAAGITAMPDRAGTHARIIQPVSRFTLVSDTRRH
ncbi:MAG: hypothetical protein LC637_09830 [Xanthomonadaceae bacterium]|nr:hypothetical protein [Xanthomonadaceae bacterium]